MEFNPSLRIKPLAAVEPGSLVLVGDVYGFCAVAAGDAAQRRAVILYDGTAFRYEMAVGSAVVDFGKGYTVSPDLDTFDQDAAAEPNGMLYFLEGAPTLVVPTESSIAFVNLATGSLSSRASWPALSGFRAWRAGVAIDGALVPLIEVGAEGAAFGEGEAFEPEHA
jgi:phage baseplate assembly protein gpV